MKEQTVIEQEHEYTIDDARAVYAAFSDQCMEMNEARLTTALGSALRKCTELEAALLKSAQERHVTYHSLFGEFETCAHSACVDARLLVAGKHVGEQA